MAWKCFFIILISFSICRCDTFGPENATVKFELKLREPKLFNQTIDINNLSNLTFIKNKPIKILIHAFYESSNAYYVVNMTTEYLKKDNLNIIVVDWAYLSQQLLTVAAVDTYFVGYKVGELLVALNKKLGLPFSLFHLIGPSLGSHVASYAGKYVKKQTGQRVGRITGLDPAGPMFNKATRSFRFDKDDAVFVDTIHTDFGLVGINYIGGDADFYPNGGVAPQPACKTPWSFITKYFSTCSHKVAPKYFVESINSYDFVASKCDEHKFLFINLSNYTSYKLGYCKDNPTALMGENCDPNAKGGYFLTVNAEPPYAQGKQK